MFQLITVEGKGLFSFVTVVWPIKQVGQLAELKKDGLSDFFL